MIKEVDSIQLIKINGKGISGVGGMVVISSSMQLGVRMDA